MIDGPNERTVQVCAGLLYRDGRVLLGKRTASRRSYPHVWDLPGGHCEEGETPQQTLVRELWEEIGVKPTATVKVATFHLADPAQAGVELHVFLVTGWEGVPRNLQPEEHAAVEWFAIEEACGLALASAEYPKLFRRVMSTVT